MAAIVPTDISSESPPPSKKTRHNSDSALLLSVDYLDSPATDEDYAHLEEWLETNGADMSMVTFAKSSDDEGYGVFARKNVAVGENVAFLPSHLILSEQVALKSEIGSTILKYNDSLDKFDYIESHICTRNILFAFVVYSYYVLQEKSPYFPYLRCLPRLYETLQYWTNEELSWLTGTNLMGVAHDKIAQVKSEWEALHAILCPEFLPSEVFTYERFLWARCSASSRAFPCDLNAISNPSVPSRQTEKDRLHLSAHVDIVYDDFEAKYPPCKSNLAMWPLFDMLNHRRGLNITWDGTKQKADGIFFKAGCGIEATQEVYNNYGAKGNDELLLSYGFCLPTDGYPDDFYPIKMNFDSDPYFSDKVSILEHFKLTKPGGIHIIRPDGLIPVDLVAAMEIIVMNVNELKWHNCGLINPTLPSSSHCTFINTRTHLLALSTLLSLLESKLHSLLDAHSYLFLPASSDPLKYVNHADSYRRRMAKIYVSGQFYILFQAIEQAKSLYTKQVRELKDAGKIVTLEDITENDEFVEWLGDKVDGGVEERTLFTHYLVWCAINSNPIVDEFPFKFDSNDIVKETIGDSHDHLRSTQARLFESIEIGGEELLLKAVAWAESIAKLYLDAIILFNTSSESGDFAEENWDQEAPALLLS